MSRSRNLAKIAGVSATRGDHHAVDALTGHELQVARLLRQIFIRVAEENRIATALRRIFHAARHRGPKCVGDIGQDQGK